MAHKLTPRQMRLLRTGTVSTADAIKGLTAAVQAMNGTKFPAVRRTGQMTKRDRAIEQAMNFSGATKDRKSE